MREVVPPPQYALAFLRNPRTIVDPTWLSPYIVGKYQALLAMDEQQLTLLEKKIADLVALCDELYRENSQLKSNQSKLQEERVQLREKNDLARSRVDNMISRLKSLEQES